jgi:hypothetical protein
MVAHKPSNRAFLSHGGEGMKVLHEADKALYFQRSYIAADGLWFMKIEEKRGFDEALETDCAVWRVMPKIQARFLKSLTRMGQGINEGSPDFAEQNSGCLALHECLTTKLDLEGFRFETQWEGDRAFILSIGWCPWYDALVKAGRTHIAAKIGKCICTAEYSVWAREFGETIMFEMLDYLCAGSRCCMMKFREEGASPRLTGDSV